jgi:hypothetical protein
MTAAEDRDRIRSLEEWKRTMIAVEKEKTKAMEKQFDDLARNIKDLAEDFAKDVHVLTVAQSKMALYSERLFWLFLTSVVGSGATWIFSKMVIV